MSEEWEIPSRDEVFMRQAYLKASRSKDRHTKIGAVLVKDNTAISDGYNGLPRRINDNIEVRWERPEKYFWCEHAERNLIYHCARHGISTENSILYCFSIPCADCCRAVINSGICEIVIHKQWEILGFTNNKKWSDSFERSLEMLTEASIIIRRFDKILNVKTMVDSKIYTV